MNYIWEIMLQADREGINREEIAFIKATAPSPYLEATFEDINTDSLYEKRVEVNPLYRFGKELGRLFDINVEDYEQTRAAFLDIFLHYMAQIDLREGLSRKDYYLKFIHKDIVSGGLGGLIKADYELFSYPEKKTICRYLLRLIQTGSYLNCFREVIKVIYPGSIVYENKDTAYELLVYLGVEESPEEVRRIGLIIKLFLPVQERVHIYYKYHFGIIGADETMVIDEMVLF